MQSGDMNKYVGMLLLAILFCGQTASGTQKIEEHAPLAVPPQAESDLAHIAMVRKFGPDGVLYTGIADPTKRSIAESTINSAISNIATGIRSHPTKTFVLEQFQRALVLLDAAGLADSEDREAAAGYLEQVMDVVGLESSDGMLNNWVYGLDASKLTGS